MSEHINTDHQGAVPGADANPANTTDKVVQPETDAGNADRPGGEQNPNGDPNPEGDPAINSIAAEGDRVRQEAPHADESIIDQRAAEARGERD